MSPRSNFTRVILCSSVLYCGPETGLYLNKGIFGLILIHDDQTHNELTAELAWGRVGWLPGMHQLSEPHLLFQ